MRKFYRDLADLCKRESCDAVWDLGDTTDDRNAIPISTVDAVLEGLEQLPDHDWNLKLIGNHEQLLRSGSVHVGRMFDRKFSVVDTTAVHKLGKVQLVCAAFPANDADLAGWLRDTLTRQANHGGYSLVLGHFQVLGCQLSSGQSTSGIPRQVLDKADLALLGHVHRHQRLGESVYYVGSPFEQDFGEANEPKRVAVVDLVDGKPPAVTWHELTGFPRHRVVNFERFSQQVSQDSEDRFKVVLSSLAETERFYAHPLSTRAEPVYDYVAVDSAGQPTPEAEGSHDWSLDRALKAYVDSTNLADRGLQVGPEDLLEFGLEIARGAAETAV